MARPKSPYTYKKRKDTKKYQFTLNASCGLPQRVCEEWQRKSFQCLPGELAKYRNPRTEADVKIALGALIEYLKRQNEEGKARKTHIADISVGDWLEKFIVMETSPRTGVNNAKNRPYSVGTMRFYKSYFDAHIKGDPITAIRMNELEEDDITQYTNRLALHKKKDGMLIGGTRTSAGVIIFLRMAFKSYHQKFPRWFNPFIGLEAPKPLYNERDALLEDEVLSLFIPGVLKTSIEQAVCSCMFLSGLRRAEIGALRPEDLDWHTPKIIVRRAWQNYDRKNKVLGPPKGKRSRDAPFDPLLQEAIKTLWQEHGKKEWVFSTDGKFLNSQWIRHRLPKWLDDAEIELNGREIVPHSARHSLATILEVRGVAERHIQELLGHSDPKTTRGYLHSTSKTIRIIGERITEAREKHGEIEKQKATILKFKVS